MLKFQAKVLVRSSLIKYNGRNDFETPQTSYAFLQFHHRHFNIRVFNVLLSHIGIYIRKLLHFLEIFGEYF